MFSVVPLVDAVAAPNTTSMCPLCSIGVCMSEFYDALLSILSRAPLGALDYKFYVAGFSPLVQLRTLLLLDVWKKELAAFA